MSATTARAVQTILEFIGRVRPGYARTLQWELARMSEEDPLDRVTQALAAISPTESKPPETAGLSRDDRALLDETRTLLDET